MKKGKIHFSKVLNTKTRQCDNNIYLRKTYLAENFNKVTCILCLQVEIASQSNDDYTKDLNKRIELLNYSKDFENLLE